MPHTLGFDLRVRMQRARRLPATEKPCIEIGDIVRPRSGGSLLEVIDVDGEHVYCAGFIDPFNAAGLESTA